MAEIPIASLGAPASVFRDEWGIPHIRATSARDVFLAQGWTSAADRLWQMDATRRQMLGRWAEWVGPAGVPADRLARRLGVAAASIRDYQALGAEARAMLDAYAEGVNAHLATLTELPVEYGLLGDRPEPWLPWHSIAVMRQRGYLMGSVWFKLWRAAAVGRIGLAEVVKLRYDDSGADRLCVPPGADARRWVADLAELTPALEALSALRGVDATGGGSNNWALAGSRTATGRPMLAGDPHRGFEMPGMYVQTHLACDEFDAIGLTVAGVPAFPHFAHNADVAWCVTHAFVDIHDLYVERFDPADPSRYRFRDEWLPAQSHTEQIEVRGGPSESVEVVTTRHGPVIAGSPAAGAALTLRSTQFASTDHSFDALPRMLRADSVNALFEATRGWGLIDHNLVAGDTAGHIGHLVRALVPRRPALNGWLPVPGWTGEYEWDGMIPFERMPRVEDPERGYLATANNRVVADEPGSGSGDYLCTDAHPPYRARRIEELLAPLTAATEADMRAIHSDDLSAPAALFQRRLAGLDLSGPAAEVRDSIVAWDARLAPDSVAATHYTRLRWALAALVVRRSGLATLAEDELAQVPPGVSATSQLWWTLPALLRTDDTALLAGWTWEQALAAALAEVAPAGDQPWAAVHSAALVHPLAGAFPESAAPLSPAGAALGGDNECVWANGARFETGTAAVYGAVARYVYDVGDWNACRWVVLAGASGDPNSPHFLDQHEPWSKCELVPMHYDWAEIAARPAATVLTPGVSTVDNGSH
jgi:penicillin amidase